MYKTIRVLCDSKNIRDKAREIEATAKIKGIMTARDIPSIRIRSSSAIAMATA
jgi:hypothetical protein